MKQGTIDAEPIKKKPSSATKVAAWRVSYFGGRNSHEVEGRRIQKGLFYDLATFPEEVHESMRVDPNLIIEPLNSEGKVIVFVDRMPPKDLALSDHVIPVLREEV